MKPPKRRGARGQSNGTPPQRALGDIWIGDVIRAWNALGPADAVERQWIAETLGFAYVEQIRADAPPDVIVQRPMATESGISSAAPTIDQSQHGDPSHHATPLATDSPLVLPTNMSSKRRTATADSLPAWASVSAALAREEPQHIKFRPAPIPLLVPRWTRAIVGAAAATRVEGGPIDFDRVIEAVCNVRPIATLPRRLIWTLRAGVQLLVDRGHGMTPFAREAGRLADHIAAVAGRDRTALLRFRDCPGPWPKRGIDADRRRQTAYEPPAPGTMVMVISDLGLTRGTEMRGGASEEDWLAFAAQVRQAGCSLVAFAPSGPSRWRPALRREFQIVAWDRSTTVGSARRIAKGEKA